MTTTDLDEARRTEGIGPDDPWPPSDDGASIADRAERDDDGEQAELFPIGSLEGDPRRTLKNLLRAGLPVEYTCSLMSAEVPLRGGLLDIESSGEVLVTWEPAKLEVVPDRDAELGKVVGVKVRQKLRPVYVRPAGQMYDRVQVVEMLYEAGATAEKVAELLGE